VSETATGINWGKLNYMSPEQRHARPLDHRSDLFSAGVILWELLTGRQLFPSAKARAEMREIPPPSQFNSSVTPGLDAVVLKALSPEPIDRFESGEQMAAALAAETPHPAGKRQLVDFIERLFATDRLAEEADQDALLARSVALGDAMPSGLGSSDDANDPLVGTVLAERYFVRRLVGQGSMGKVYEGHHTGVGKRVAIKVARQTERRKTNLLQRFQREAQAASQIGHVNIADVTDCGTTPAGGFFFVMEFIDGIDLEKLVGRDGALPLERVLVFGLQIARALEAAHQAGIIHRDLKPSNVMVLRERDEAELIKVLDFGVAKFLRGDTAGHDKAAAGAAVDITQHDAAVGTPRYMAPEQIGAGREIDFRADIYALGGVLFFMLSGGRAPVEGDTVQHVWERKLTQDPTPLREFRPDIPQELEVLVMSCLAREPAARPPSMGALKAALVASLERIRAMEPGLLPQKEASRTQVASDLRWRKILGGTGGLLLVGTIVAVIWRTALDSAESRATLREMASSPPAASITSGSGPPPPRVGSRGSGTIIQQLAPPRSPPPIYGPPAPAARTTAVARAAASTPAASPVATRPEEAAPEPREAAPRSEPRLAAESSASSPPSRETPPGLAAAPASYRMARRPPPGDAPAGGAEVERLLGEGESLFQRGRFVPSLNMAEKAVRAGGGVRAYLLVGKIQLETEEFGRAVEAYTHVLQLDPGNPTALRGIEKARERFTSQGGRK
jgi:serine/threonine-protein kinase